MPISKSLHHIYKDMNHRSLLFLVTADMESYCGNCCKFACAWAAPCTITVAAAVVAAAAAAGVVLM